LTSVARALPTNLPKKAIAAEKYLLFVADVVIENTDQFSRFLLGLLSVLEQH
jgi:hypothetical protein